MTHARVLVAVSGGADSVALLRGLLTLQFSLGLSLHVAHLNHQLRGVASNADAAWVESLCQQVGVPCHIGSRAVADMPEMSKQGLEGAARLARRQFLQDVAREHDCSQIALAHTADDQVETILHHIVRGTGLVGLAGMQSISEINDPEDATEQLPHSIPFVRPMLSINRQQVESYLAELRQDFRTDASNQDTRLTRNRIRHELLPLLEREFNPQVRQALLRLGQQSREILKDETELAEQVLNEALVECTPRLCRLLCGPFINQPSHRIRECFVVLWKRQNWPRQHMGFRDWNRLVDLLSQAEGAVTLPGQVQARCIGGELTIQSVKLARPQ
jgi:tRNA(Ile)-lysidine synthase